MSAIIVDGVSKQFRLQKDRAHSIKELITRRDRNAGVDQFWALRDVSLRDPRGLDVRPRRPQRLGQVHAAALHRRHLPAHHRVDPGRGPHLDAARARRRLPPRPHRPRERLPERHDPRHVASKQIDARLDEIVDFAGVGEFIDSPVKIYSSGMYVRLGFSVAVHVDPEILIIDEVIAVGDEEFQRQCFDHLYALRKKGVTIVVVTHGLGTVETMCDGAAWLDHGVLQLTGTGPEVAAAYMDQVNAGASAATRDAGRGPRPRRSPQSAGTSSERRPHRGRAHRPGRVHRRRRPGDAVRRPPRSAHHPHLVRRRPAGADPVFGIALHSTSGVHLTGTNTKIDEVDTGTVAGPGPHRLRRRLAAAHARRLRADGGHLRQFVQHDFDRREREWHLPVRPGGRLAPEGLMDLRGSWTTGDRMSAMTCRRPA